MRDSVRNASNEDTAAYADYSKLMGKFAKALEPSWYKTMPRIGSLAVGDLMTFAQMGLKLGSWAGRPAGIHARRLIAGARHHGRVF